LLLKSNIRASPSSSLFRIAFWFLSSAAPSVENPQPYREAVTVVSFDLLPISPLQISPFISSFPPLIFPFHFAPTMEKEKYQAYE